MSPPLPSRNNWGVPAVPLLRAIVLVPVPSALLLVMTRLPWVTVTLPVNVFAPLSRQVPVPFLTRDVTLVALLLGMTPAISPTPAVDPIRLSVLLPPPVAVTADEKTSVPVPAISTVAPAVVPFRLRVRLVVAPVPVYRRVPLVVVLLPMLIVVPWPSGPAVPAG